MGAKANRFAKKGVKALSFFKMMCAWQFDFEAFGF